MLQPGAFLRCRRKRNRGYRVRGIVNREGAVVLDHTSGPRFSARVVQKNEEYGFASSSSSSTCVDTRSSAAIQIQHLLLVCSFIPREFIIVVKLSLYSTREKLWLHRCHSYS